MGIRTKILAPYKTKTPLETMEESRGFTGPYWDHRMGGDKWDQRGVSKGHVHSDGILSNNFMVVV